MRVTSFLRYYKNDTTRKFANPSRRWVYHYVIFGSLGLGAVYMLGSYELAGLEARFYQENSARFLCSSAMTDLMFMLPSNRVSNAFGRLSEPGILPEWVHHKAIEWLIRFHGIDMSASEQQEFTCLQDFYVREWTKDARPVASTALVVCPCDGEVLSAEPTVADTTLFQIKGVRYGMQSLFRTSLPDVPAGKKRAAVVIRLRTNDFHHVIAPAPFHCRESIYVPGALLPANAAGFHWIPSVLTMNERLVVHGPMKDDAAASFAMALVGSTLSGRIKLAFDRRIRTNFLDPPEYAVHTPYASLPVLSTGSKVGTFYWGSTVALVVDVPVKTELLVRAGQVVKAGEPLITTAKA